MQKLHPCAVEERRVSGQKERRLVDTLAPLVQQHRLIFNTELIQSDWAGAERDPETGHPRSLLYQMSRITIERGALQFDDRIDALALGCAYFVEAAAQDQERAKAALDVFQEKLVKRGLSLKSFEAGEPRSSGKEYKINGTFKAGISQEQAKKIGKLIRDEGPKSIKTQVMGDELRVTGKSRDDLQEVIALVKGADLDFAVQFDNYR
jgi:uncharacterized protein YajQ (UPF0234 family)